VGVITASGDQSARIRDACQMSPDTNTRSPRGTLAVPYSLEYQNWSICGKG
jgi:hypothetical protein